MESGSDGMEKDDSMQKNLALLALTQKFLQMEENVEEIKRNLQVLEFKVNLTYQNLQKSILDKVEAMVDRKMVKLRKEVK